jgi:alkyl hydroperoxide reductase subunit AhpC
VLIEDIGIALRGLFIIDPSGILHQVRQASIAGSGPAK